MQEPPAVTRVHAPRRDIKLCHNPFNVDPMTCSINQMAHQLERDHGLRSHTTARRLVQAYADRIADREDLWDGTRFTPLGAQYLQEDINDVLEKMASACQAATIAPTLAPGELPEERVVDIGVQDPMAADTIETLRDRADSPRSGHQRPITGVVDRAPQT